MSEIVIGSAAARADASVALVKREGIAAGAALENDQVSLGHAPIRPRWTSCSHQVKQEESAPRVRISTEPIPTTRSLLLCAVPSPPLRPPC